MATIEETLRELLFSDPTVGGKVGNTSATARIFIGGSVPQNVPYPFLQIEKVTDLRTHETRGGKHVFQEPSYQVSSWGTTYPEAKTLNNDVINAIDGTTTANGAPFGVIAGVENDLFDADAQVHQIALDFKVLTAPLA